MSRTGQTDGAPDSGRSKKISVRHGLRNEQVTGSRPEIDYSKYINPQFTPPSIEPTDWLCVINYLIFADGESNMFEVEALGVFWGFAQVTSTKILARITDRRIEKYELLLQFASPEKKETFLRLMECNELTQITDDYLIVPSSEQMSAARPLEQVFDGRILNEARTVAEKTVRSVMGAP
jgi:hypothetical protein